VPSVRHSEGPPPSPDTVKNICPPATVKLAKSTSGSAKRVSSNVPAWVASVRHNSIPRSASRATKTMTP
jgi:hypothetical protein